MRTIFITVVATAAVGFGLQSAKAYTAPWCAVINNGTGSAYWDCQYRSFEECYRNGNVLAGNRGWCNPSPYFASYAATPDKQYRKRHTRSQ
ncbi:MAG: DUF3551 domain-containing protein [Pseudolabrys sp.]|jgi:hypothetical protein